MFGFVRGGVFNDGIQSVLVLFSMVGGCLVLIGECGLEVIMLLSCGFDGVFGVCVFGGGEGGNVFNFFISVSLGGGCEGVVMVSGDDGMGQQLVGMINDVVCNVVVQELCFGGLVWRMVNG